MDKFMVGMIVGAMLAVLGVALYFDGQERAACEVKGGVRVERGCFKIERIK